MRKKLLGILIAIMSVCCALFLTACDEMEGNLENWGSVFTVQTAYAEAQELGYAGTLEEFLQSIQGKDGANGKDGVGISSVEVVDGKLIVTLSDSTVIDCGVVVGKDGKDGVGIKEVKIVNDYLFVVLTDGSELNVGKVVGEDGSKGEDGVGVSSIDVNIDGTALVAFTDGTTKNLGKIVGEKGEDGVSVENVTLENYQLKVTLSNGTELNLGNIRGEKGEDGADGEDGDSVSSASINNNGELVLTFVSGKNITVGNVVGANGKDGVSVENVTLENYQLKVTLSNGTELNLGNIRGEKGEDGADGEDGDSVSSASINNNGELVLTFASGKNITVGNVVGEKGQDGTNGENGVGISLVCFNELGEIVVTYTDGTTDNLGKIPVCQHTYSQWALTKPATCTSIGYNTRQCSICNNIEYEFLDKLGHTFGEWEDIIHNDSTQWQVRSCTVCGDSQVKHLDPVVHIVSDWIIDVEATCMNTGSMHKECTVCKTVLESQTIPMNNNHKYNDNDICTLCGQERPSEGLEYELSADETYYSVVGIGTCTDLNVVIASRHLGLPVTTIGEDAFRSCSSLTGITIPKSITTIDTYAFYGCSSLTSITIPDKVTSIGSYAFYNCTVLTEIKFNATAMKDLSSSSYVFSEAGQSGEGLKVTIGKNVTKIPAYLFYKVYRITSVEFEEGSVCTSIGTYAFYGCSSLTSITIPDKVTSIGKDAFYGCSSLTSATIGENVTSIGYRAFSHCTALTEIKFNATECADLSSGNYVFYEAGQSGEGIKVTIGKNVTKIPAYLFNPYNSSSYSPKITSVEFEEGSVCTSIGNFEFAYCDSLTSIVIPDKVTNIGYLAFAFCSSLTSVTIGNSVQSIGDSAFYDCDSLTRVEITDINAWAMIEFGNYSANPLCYANHLYINGEEVTEVVLDTATKVSSYAFYDCDSLTSVTIGENVKTIGGSAFYNCSSLTSVTIGNQVQSIGKSAFSHCTALTEIKFNATAMNDLSSGSYVFSEAGQSGEGIKVTIGKNVTKIPAYLFYKVYRITSVEFEEGSVCTSIGDYAFNECTALTEIKFNATAMNDLSEYNYVFYNAGQSGEGIKVIIGKNVTKIPACLFSTTSCPDSPKITSVKFEEGSVCTSIGSSAFYYCSSLTSITIPENVTSIGDWSFSSCKSLTSVTIGNQVQSIGSSAFYNCDSLTSVTIPDSVTSIGKSAFGDCIKLTSVTIGENVESIGYEAFRCHKLVEVINKSSLNITVGSTDNGYVGYYAKQVITDESQSKIITSGDYKFYNDNGTYYLLGYTGTATDITLPENINGYNYEIYWFAFYNNDKITSVVIPNGVTRIGEYAFQYCSLLTSVTIGSGVTSIGSYAFESCGKLTSIVIPTSVTSIGSSAFRYCYKLVEVINKSSLNITVGSSSNGYVGYYAKQVLKEEPATSNFITSGDYIFYNDNGTYYLIEYIGTATEITLPENINGYNYQIYEYAFYNNDKITSVVIPAGVTSIGDHAFAGCESLTSIVIPDSVTSIGSHAFYYCSSLTSITIPENVTSIGDSAFYACTSLTSVTIGENVETIGSDAFRFCRSLTSINIPNSVTSIGSYAFYDCTSLTSITFEDTSTWYYTANSNHNFTGGTEVDVTNPSTNATYLKSTYYNKYWYKV